MHKSVITFLGLLAILLLLGSSNMNISNANAITDFDDKDSKQVSVNSLKCNNINVNVNGLELDVFPTFLANSGLAAEAVDGSSDPSSIAGNGADNTEIKDFRFICINNNDNIVIEPTPPPTTTIPTTELDMAVANVLDNDVSIRLGNGEGTFTLPANSSPDVAVGFNPRSIAVGDFDNN